MNRTPVTLLASLCLWSGLLFGKPAFSFDLTLEVDLGQDLGQNFGTLFEARDESGRLVLGAGFPAVYNSYYRSERNKIEFFYRPSEDADRFEIEPFPRPNAIPSTYVYDLGDGLYVNHKTIDDGLVKFDSGKGAWTEAEGSDLHGVSVATVRGKRLETLNADVVYDGKVVFETPEHPIYRYYYYGKGHLHFYRETKGEDGEVQKAVVAIPWTPYDDPLQADIASEIVLDIFMPPEFPYAYGQIGDKVLTCSNWGGLYAFNGTEWRILREPVENVSYQVYTMINYGDRLLMGQYPTGFFIAFDGNEVQVLEGWPPVPSPASPSARELQTSMIYRGELFAGVWPWAELWRLDPDTNDWKAMGRLFKNPEVHKRTVHPYEEEATAAGLVLNQLGQRLTSMVLAEEGMVMGTSWKGGETLLEGEKFESLTQEQREEFGAPHRLEMPGALSAILEWKDKPTRFRFLIEEGKMSLHQDGKEIGSTEIGAPWNENTDELDIQFENGIFGPFDGESITFRGVETPRQPGRNPPSRIPTDKGAWGVCGIRTIPAPPA